MSVVSNQHRVIHGGAGGIEPAIKVLQTLLLPFGYRTRKMLPR
jgi:hypothetical protein